MIYQAKHQKRRKDNFIRRLMALFLAIILTLSVLSLDNLFSLFPVRAVAAENGLAEHIIDTVSPAHVTFNLFDYWVDTQNSRYNQNWNVQKGINQGHPFLFSDGAAGRGPWNVWTGNADHYNATHQEETRYGVYTGIVNQSLQNGYPTLALEDDYPQKGQPTFITNNHLQDKLTESLAYLFDPDVSNDYKAVYENVQGLVKYDGNGGYVYNSHQNYAAFQEYASGTLGTNGEPSAGYFDVYDNWGLTSGGSPNGQFFPFDGADEVFATDTNGNYQVGDDGKLVPKGNVALDGSTTTLNHYMGLTMETVFLQPENGKIDASTPMSFSFSGDDDVWIFIDGVLVSDLGGIHDECFTIIDFETGTVYTGLTPMVKNSDGTFSEAMPTLQELRAAENGESIHNWTWCDRASTGKNNTYGTYEQFKAAHGIHSTTLKDIFTAADQSDTQAWGDESGMSADTFDQNTQHELKMFYLERGAGASNLVLEFNMLAVPASGITKTDQEGNPVSGAIFELWPAKVSDTEKDENGFAAPILGEDGLYVADKSGGTPICTATTDASGQLNFITENRKIISFQERAQRSDPELYYVLEETGLPPGYRSNGNISLYYSIYNQQTREGVLLSYNYWETGAYTQAKLDVTMTEKLYAYTLDNNGQAGVGAQIGEGQEDITDYLDNGIIFAVPIKRIDMNGSLYDERNLYAIYGTMNSGWTMMHNPISDKASVLEAAKGMVRVMQENHQSGTIIAERNARQLFHVEVSNIPGDVKLSYPYLKGSEKENNAQYNVAFYFAPNADSLDDVDPTTIVRIATEDESGNSFERQYASQFYVPNTFNRVRVQKLNYQGERLAGAQFTMYQTYSTQPRADYERVGENSTDTGHIGLYRNTAIVNEDGTLKDRTEILKTTPWDKGKTMSEGSTGTGGLDLDGAIIFPTAFDAYVYGDQTGGYQVNPNDTSTYMEEGEYVILETSAPAGYEANDATITVTVNDDGVFADAGEVNDGVRVGQYTGWILNSLSQFAAEGPVDATLTFVKTNLKVIDEDRMLKSPVEGDMTWQNKYSNQNHRYISLAEDVGRYITAGRNLYQYTDEGTPRLVIQQNQDVTAQVIVFLGTDATNNSAHYMGPVTVNKKNEDGTIYSLAGQATNGALAFWLRKGGTAGGAQTLDSVEINGETLTKDVDYRVYTPNVNDLSGFDDLSGLFSVETLIQVFDQGYGSLAVTKETENTPEGSALKEDEIFHFRIYSSYENATKVVLAKTSDSEIVLNSETGQPETVDFTGTLNVRLRQAASGDQATQDTATTIAVDFVDGEGMLYLQPNYDVEYVFIPENRDHPVYNGLSHEEDLVGLVETRITLSDSSQSGQATITAQHVAFTEQTHTHTITFTDGVGTLYRNPDYTITQVSFDAGWPTYTTNGSSTFKVDTRFQYATPDRILDVPARGEVDVSFTEDDRVVTAERPQEGSTIDDGGVTVYRDDEGYKLAYSLSSNTNENAVVAQFALHSGQTITVNQLPSGATYYVYEYAVGENGSREDLENWETNISWDANLPYEEIEGYRAVRGTIALGDTVQAAGAVTFTNSAHVGQLTISKTVAGDQATDSDRSQSFTFTVALKDKNGNALRGTYSYKGGTVEGINGVSAPASGTLTLNSGSATFTLKHGQSITIEDIPDGATYEVTEEDHSGFTVVVDDDTDADQAAEGTITVNKTSKAHFTNIKQSALTFTKVAAEDHSSLLPGAEFALYRLNCTDPENHDHSTDLVKRAGGCWSLVGTKTSGETGEVSFGSLESGHEYRLVETKAPDGRVLPEGQWRVVTDENNRIEITAVGGQSGRLPPAFATGKSDELLLPNVRPIDIPSSGGFGALPFLLGGGLLMLTAAGIFIGKRLREKWAALK